MATTYIIDNDGDETRTDFQGLRKMAKANGILDTDVMDATDLMDTIMDCFPEVSIHTEET